MVGKTAARGLRESALFQRLLEENNIVLLFWKYDGDCQGKRVLRGLHSQGPARMEVKGGEEACLLCNAQRQTWSCGR